MKAVSGIDSISMDTKDNKLTVIGNVDLVDVVSRLRKQAYTEILTVGPAKEEKKDGTKKNEGVKKDDDEHVNAYNNDNILAEENPNSYVIC
ncbi:hypothetical protein DITRI_Ditri04bG0130800 [Diplodiscus trichospermus]